MAVLTCKPPLLRLLTLTLLTIALLSCPAAARLCGDDVDGHDVPCDCGDTLVSSIVLGDDPVVAAACDGDALSVYAPQRSAPIVIDLAGRVLRGVGNGTGIHVINGGSAGVEVISSGGMAQIESFRDGIVARLAPGITLLQGVSIESCGRDGVRLVGDYAVLDLVDVRRVGRDGFSLRGHELELRQVRALDNGRFGFLVTGSRAHLGFPAAGATSSHNARDGFLLIGSEHELIGCDASSNGEDGIHLNGVRFHVEGCFIGYNAGGAIGGNLSNNRLFDNQIVSNGARAAQQDVPGDASRD